MALRPTTALREPWNYGLRGWISTRSNDQARGTVAGTFEGVLPKVPPVGRLSGRIVRHSRPFGRSALGTYSRERVRHEDVEWPDGPAIAGVDGSGHDARGRRSGFWAAAQAVGIHAAGSRDPRDGKHHQLP